MAVCLKIIHGIGQGQTLTVPNDQPITLGRSSQASYAFDDPLLSRKHCAIECRGNASRVVDLQSRNGTFVNGQRIAAPQLLKMGDKIKIGSILMEVAPAAPVPAVAPMPGMPGMPIGAPAPLPDAPTMRSGHQNPGPMDYAATLPAPTPSPLAAGPAICEACRRPLQPHEIRPFKGRVVCPKCLDKYDVDEDMIEGFKIIERIAATGTGTVYKAKQLLMGRLVILKTLVTGGQADEKALRRFMREAKAGGRLSHPSIVELYDVNEQGDLMYIVMEYIDGETLEQMLKSRGPLPVAEVLRYMVHIADALRYAHSEQIIHRDIRPATIVVRKEDGRAKLTDFTLAKNLERAAFSVITADGEAIGTPYYMPPEQVKSAKAADMRSDIYSFAAAFYHVLSGKFPIEARSYGEFITKVFTHEPPQLSAVLPSAPPKLTALLAKAMSKDPNARFQDVEQLMGELTQIQKTLAAAGA